MQNAQYARHYKLDIADLAMKYPATLQSLHDLNSKYFRKILETIDIKANNKNCRSRT